MEQLLFIVLEFQEYYKEKCTSHTMTPGEHFLFIVLEFQQHYNENYMIYKRHYYYCTLRKAAVINTIVGYTNRELGDQEVWGVCIDFQSIHSKWTIDAILQHMGFYVTTENPNVVMRENHNTQSSKYIII